MQIRIQVKYQYEIIQFPSNHTHTKQSTNSKSHTKKKMHKSKITHTKTKCATPKSLKKMKLHTKY